jgi:hypothetical protein
VDHKHSIYLTTLFVKFPIATDYGKGEPRLLVVSSDVAEGIPVTFDSYEKGKDVNGKEIRNTVYYKDSSQREEKTTATSYRI